MLDLCGMLVQAVSCAGFHQQRVVDGERMLVAEHGLAHPTGAPSSCRLPAIGGGKPLPPGALDEQTLGGDLSDRRVHTRVRHLAQPARDRGIGRMLVGCEPELAHRSDERYPEAALQIADKPLHFTLGARPIRLAQPRQKSRVLGVVEEASMEAGTPRP